MRKKVRLMVKFFWHKTWLFYLLFFGILLTDLHPSPSTTSPKKIALLIKKGLQGEISFAHRVEAACQNLNWESSIFEIEKFSIAQEKDYDIILQLVPGYLPERKKKHYSRMGKYYLSIFHPHHHYFNKGGYLKKRYRGYGGYLFSYDPSLYPEKFEPQQIASTHWYPSVQQRDYQKVLPKYLFLLGSVWGNRYFDQKMHRLFELLDKENFVQTYGSPLIKPLFPHSYQSRIPFDSVSLYEKESESGIILLIHSDEHNSCGIPSGRIFEAAASSAVIISDQNSFVREHFKDAVLYIDTSASPEAIHQQILAHVEWIMKNKEKALEMAKQAYSLYQTGFSLEGQLLALGEFHDAALEKIPKTWLDKLQVLWKKVFTEGIFSFSHNGRKEEADLWQSHCRAQS